MARIRASSVSLGQEMSLIRPRRKRVFVLYVIYICIYDIQQITWYSSHKIQHILAQIWLPALVPAKALTKHTTSSENIQVKHAAVYVQRIEG